jgi:hypothetical protein
MRYEPQKGVAIKPTHDGLGKAITGFNWQITDMAGNVISKASHPTDRFYRLNFIKKRCESRDINLTLSMTNEAGTQYTAVRNQAILPALNPSHSTCSE